MGDKNFLILTQIFFDTYQQYFYFQYQPRSGQLKMFQNLSFILLALQQKKLNSLKVYHLKMLFEENFLRLTITACFWNRECHKNVNFFALSNQKMKWRSCPKQIFCPPTFLKSWIQISDNIASVIETYSTTRGGTNIGIGEISLVKYHFQLFIDYLDYVFTFNDLLDLEKLS